MDALEEPDYYSLNLLSYCAPRPEWSSFYEEERRVKKRERRTDKAPKNVMVYRIDESFLKTKNSGISPEFNKNIQFLVLYYLFMDIRNSSLFLVPRILFCNSSIASTVFISLRCLRKSHMR